VNISISLAPSRLERIVAVFPRDEEGKIDEREREREREREGERERERERERTVEARVAGPGHE